MGFYCKKLTSVNGEDIKKIYLAVGWADENCDTAILSQLAKKSTIFIGAFDDANHELIGMGRVLSDGISDACIQDVAVLPEYRNKGIGKAIIQMLVDECLKKKIDWIQLIATPAGKKLYESCGFEVMNDHVPMKFKLKDA
jgi:ribosomal protein S18 acetylase RimI-like enzyme